MQAALPSERITSACFPGHAHHAKAYSSCVSKGAPVTVGRVSTARLLGMCGNHG
jgi:hypothetical protein